MAEKRTRTVEPDNNAGESSHEIGKARANSASGLRLPARQPNQAVTREPVGVEAQRCDPPSDPEVAATKFGHVYTQNGENTDGELPTIEIQGGELPRLVDEAEEALLARPEHGVYQRGGQLVNVARTRVKESNDGVTRDGGALTIHPLTSRQLVETFTRCATWVKYDARKQDVRRVDCPVSVAGTYLSRVGRWRTPVLTGIIEAPTLRPDGTILRAPGYDDATGLLLDTPHTRFPPIPESPSRDGALEALAELKELLVGFPFVDRADQSVAIAAILTALVRRSIRSAPMFAFNAPMMGSGKSLLADVVALIATRRVAATMSQGRSGEENQKVMLSVLLKGDLVVCIDNVERPIHGDTLATVLTQSAYQGRILGHSTMAQVPTNALFLATGNNLTFAGDMTSRAVICTIDPKCERPEEREFSVDLRKFISRHRPRLVRAGLTVLRAYIVAGRPPQAIRQFGRFEDWSDLVRSALVWLGEADPCDTRQRIEADDPRRAGLEIVLTAWNTVFGNLKLTLAEALAKIESAAGSEDDVAMLQRALTEVSGDDRGRITPRNLASWLRKVEGRIVRGKKFLRAGKTGKKVLRWQVVEADRGPGPGHQAHAGH